MNSSVRIQLFASSSTALVIYCFLSTFQRPNLAVSLAKRPSFLLEKHSPVCFSPSTTVLLFFLLFCVRRARKHSVIGFFFRKSDRYPFFLEAAYSFRTLSGQTSELRNHSHLVFQTLTFILQGGDLSTGDSQCVLKATIVTAHCVQFFHALKQQVIRKNKENRFQWRNGAEK